MIQRIQSIHLLLASIALIIPYFSPLAIFVSGEQAYQLFACHVETSTVNASSFNVIPLAALYFLGLLIALVSIFLFKKRKMQIKIARMAMFVVILSIALAGYYFYSIQSQLSITGQPAFAAAMPIVACVFLFMGIRAIKKDEALVRSADRIR